MEELLELKQAIIDGDYDTALLLVEDMEEMSKDDKINKVASYAVILLVHLIKQALEQRTTKSWQSSIDYSLAEIKRHNKRRKSGGIYLNKDELLQALDEAFDLAVIRASNETLNGALTPEEIAQKLDRQLLLKKAFQLIYP